MYILTETSAHYAGDIFDIITGDILQLKVKYELPICLMGDFNACTNESPDYYTREDLATLPAMTGPGNNMRFIIQAL